MAGEDEDTRDLETLKTADLLYESNEIRKLYELLSKQKESKNAEILWRLARAARDYSQMSTVSKELKKTLVYEGYKAAEEAVRIDENIFACHKVTAYPQKHRIDLVVCYQSTLYIIPCFFNICIYKPH